MSQKGTVLVVNLVNERGLFQYLEAFYENKISYRIYAGAESKETKTNERNVNSLSFFLFSQKK